MDSSTYGEFPTPKTKEYIRGLFVPMWNAVLLASDLKRQSSIVPLSQAPITPVVTWGFLPWAKISFYSLLSTTLSLGFCSKPIYLDRVKSIFVEQEIERLEDFSQSSQGPKCTTSLHWEITYSLSLNTSLSCVVPCGHHRMHSILLVIPELFEGPLIFSGAQISLYNAWLSFGPLNFFSLVH
jgi:hypothetical protein